MSPSKNSNTFSIPNLLSMLRIGLVPVLLSLAFNGLATAFLICLVISLITDVLDGYLARHLNQESELGSRLDTWGDILTYGCMAVGLMYLWPQQFEQQLLFVMIAISTTLVSLLVSVARFGKFPSYHTWSAKIAAGLISPAYLWLAITGDGWPFRLVILFHIWVSIEGVMITLLLKEWRCNIPSVFQVIKKR